MPLWLYIILLESDNLVIKREVGIMNKNKIFAVLGLILPIIIAILMIGMSTYYSGSMLLRAICVIVASVNCSISFRLAYLELKKKCD